MTLKECFEYILQNPCNWNYYDSEYVDYDEIAHLFEDEKNAYSFIKRYFKDGGKGKVVPLYSKNMVGRWTHTISVYLLGIYIGEKLWNVNFKYNHNNLYYWYLTCLYHDCGYIIENNRNIALINTSIDKAKIRNCSIIENLDAIYANTMCEFSKSTVKDYYNKRRENKVIDHGIAGGILLYSKLSEILKIKLDGEPVSFEGNTLWHYEHPNDYARCANAIIAHNIWFNQYKDIDELNDDKHLYKDWLTALLILCDTIEPIKRYTCCKPDVVLNNIIFDIDTVKDNIRLTIDMRNWKCCNYEILEKQCASINDWTKITVKYEDGIITLDYVNKLYDKGH